MVHLFSRSAVCGRTLIARGEGRGERGEVGRRQEAAAIGSNPCFDASFTQNSSIFSYSLKLGEFGPESKNPRLYPKVKTFERARPL